MMSQSALVEQHEALADFLEGLLCEEDTESPVEPPASATPEAAATAPTPVAGDEPVPEVEEGVDQSTVQAEAVADERIPVIPDWGLQAFQVMVFKVGELSLAIPLAELAGVLEWPAGLATAAGQQGLLLGTCEHDGETRRVIDTARLLLPATDYHALYAAAPGSRNTRVILLGQGKFGLACDAVHEVVTIQPRQVRWRSTRTRRQWLAGTLLDELLVILDSRTTAKFITENLDMTE